MSDPFNDSDDRTPAATSRSRISDRTGSYRKDRAHITRWIFQTIAGFALALCTYCIGLLQGHESRITRMEATQEALERARSREWEEVKERLRRIEDRLDAMQRMPAPVR